MAQGICFQPQTTNPFPSPTTDKGLWIDNSNNLIFEGATEVNITQTLATLEAEIGNPSAASSVTPKVIVGESLLANTSYVVRWALQGQTVGTVYRANAATAANNQYLGIGIVSSTSAISTGSTQTITSIGSYTLASGDTVFSAGQIGLPLFLKNDGSGGFTLTPSTTPGDAQFQIGIVESATSIWVDLKNLNSVVPPPNYDERLLFPSGLAANTNITIPVNSRNGSIQETYSPTGGDLKVFLNELFKNQTVDWVAIDNETIQFNYALASNAEVHFVKNQLSSGVLTGTGGGGGSGTLQEAYNAGSSITTVTSVPFTVSGPAGQKIAQFNGNIGVSGVVDPTGVQLLPQNSNPLAAGQSGIWMDSSSNLNSTNGTSTTNISQVINNVIAGTAQTTLSNSYANNTGATIPIFYAVYIPSSGNIAPADGTNEPTSVVLGITTSAILNSSSGLVAYAGYLPGVSGLTVGAYVYLGLIPGTLTSTIPSVVNGFPVGFSVVKIGIFDGTNLVLGIQPLYVL